MSHYFAFVALVAVLVLIPGPAVILVMQKAVTTLLVFTSVMPASANVNVAGGPDSAVALSSSRVPIPIHV